MIQKATKPILLALLLVFAFSNAHSQAFGKKILLEKITSAGCPGCPWGDYLIDSFIQLDTNLIPVAIHRSDFWHPDLMASPDGDSILDEYLWAHPTIMVDRYKWPQYAHVSNTINYWSTMIADRNQTPLVVSLGGSTVYNPATRQLDVTLNGLPLWELPYDVRTNVYVVESPVADTGLGYDQLNGYNNSPGNPLYQLGDPIVGYVHHWVLRDMLGGHHGLQSLARPLPGGQAFQTQFSTVLDANWDENNVYVILIVQKHNADPDMREILNCAKLPLNASVAMGNEAVQAHNALEIWPNPATDVLHVAFPSNDNWQLELRDLQGKLLQSLQISGKETALSTQEFAAGMYILNAKTDGKAGISQKISLR